jgi:CBS domain containing-hemolysin-like protein
VSRQALSWLIRGEKELQAVRAEERRMIDRIFQFSQTQVREVMIPLIEVCAVEERATVGEVVDRVVREGYSRLPVYRERIDHILGIIRSFDLLGADSSQQPVAPYIRKAPFVPESMPVDELMLQLQRGGQHMAIVVDEYGGGVGIVTMEDLLEEIVGEIMDEYDVQEAQLRKVASNQFVVNARMEIDGLKEALGIEIAGEDFETLGGFLLKEFRRIPAQGESLIFRGVQFTVQRADDRSIQEVLVTLPKGHRLPGSGGA